MTLPKNMLMAFAALLMLPAAASASPTIKSGLSCTFEFDVISDSKHGDMAPGEKLAATMNFTLGDKEAHGDTWYFHATGMIKAAHPQHGNVTGDINYVHVTRSAQVADYVSIGAQEVQGNLGGENRNFDPMLVSLYSERGTLNDFDLAMTSDTLNTFELKRVFQFHSPAGHKAQLFKVGPMNGACT